MRFAFFTRSGDGQEQTIILLRWILIIATAYVILFHRPLAQTPPVVGLFVAAYLASNVVASFWARRVRSRRFFEIAIVLFDAIAVSVALLISEEGSTDLILLYFVVMFTGSLSERVELVAIGAVLIGSVHLYTTSHLGGEHALSAGQLLRIPFLFAVALFFGHMVQRARSAERQADEARKREQMRMEFVSGVTHDLKNPLHVIESMTQLLLEGARGPLNDGQADFLRRVHANSRRLIALTLNLLDSARIEAGRLDLERAPTSLAELVEEVIALARTAADLKSIRVAFQPPSDLPPADVDPVQASRMVANLVDNAIRYTPEGGSVTVTIENHSRSLRLTIADNGPGIPAEQLPTLFDRYHRTTGGKLSGSGFGLFVVKAIVDAHGGILDVKTRIGEGTTFTIDLPAHAVSGAAA